MRASRHLFFKRQADISFSRDKQTFIFQKNKQTFIFQESKQTFLLQENKQIFLKEENYQKGDQAATSAAEQANIYLKSPAENEVEISSHFVNRVFS
jgi:hypothetical protein